jgi:hypothetical protein
MKPFQKWLQAALKRLDRFKESFDWPVAASAQDVFEAAGAIAEELGKRAAALGLHDLVAEATDLEGAADPDAVRTLVAKGIAACGNKGKSKCTETLTVPEAAAALRIGEESVRTKCKKGELEHRREGTRGRGGKGTILIPRSAIEAYSARQAVCRTPLPDAAIPKARKKPKVPSTHW